MGLRPGLPELLIIVVLVVLLFGVGRISKVAGELGSGIRAFRKGLQQDDSDQTKNDQEDKTTPPND